MSGLHDGRRKEELVLKQIVCLQLLFQLIPEVITLDQKDLLHFLNAVSKREDSNKNQMSASNLGTIRDAHVPAEAVQGLARHTSCLARPFLLLDMVRGVCLQSHPPKAGALHETPPQQ